MPNETFADRLKLAMDRQGKKQVDLIHLASEQGIKLGKSHISQYVSGKTVPRAEILHFLSGALKVDEEWLRNGKTDNNDSEHNDYNDNIGILSDKNDHSSSEGEPA